jgi:ribosomal protein S18 acetylase RimI-like enzyme
MVKRVNLDGEELEQLRALERSLPESREGFCFDWPLIERPAKHQSTFLIIEGTKLLAYARVFLFYQDMAEVLLYAEFNRRSALFAQLMSAVRAFLEPRNISNVLLQGAYHQPDFLKARDFELKELELLMEKRLFAQSPANTLANEVEVTIAERSDLEAIFALDKAVFKEDNFINLGELSKQLILPDREILILKEQTLRAKLHLRYDKDKAIIQNLCVAPEYLQQGYGKQLVKEAERHAKERQCKVLSLWVAKDNRPAVSLYQSTGFHIAKEQSYWQKCLELPNL